MKCTSGGAVLIDADNFIMILKETQKRVAAVHWYYEDSYTLGRIAGLTEAARLVRDLAEERDVQGSCADAQADGLIVEESCLRKR